MFSARPVQRPLSFGDCIVKLFFLHAFRTGLCVFHLVALFFLPWFLLAAGLLLHLFLLFRTAVCLSAFCDAVLPAAGLAPAPLDSSSAVQSK